MSNQVDYEINKELGECYLFMGEYDKAHEYYTKAVNCDKTQSDPFMGLAAVALGKGSFNEALTLYTKANAIRETDKSLSGMGMVEAELGQHEKAFTHYSKALVLNPVNMIAINGLVQLCYFMNRLDEAVVFLQRALSEKNDEVIRYALAGCLLALGREEESREHLEILLSDNPENQAAQQLYALFAA